MPWQLDPMEAFSQLSFPPFKQLQSVCQVDVRAVSTQSELGSCPVASGFKKTVYGIFVSFQKVSNILCLALVRNMLSSDFGETAERSITFWVFTDKNKTEIQCFPLTSGASIPHQQKWTVLFKVTASEALLPRTMWSNVKRIGENEAFCH